MDGCKPLVYSPALFWHMHMAMGPHSFSIFRFQLATASKLARSVVENASTAAPAPRQGLTLVHFSAQLERFVWDRGCT